MRILIFGAGVIGKIYGGKLFRHKNDVTLFARRDNFLELRKNGLSLINRSTGEETQVNIPVIRNFEEAAGFDLIIVTVRLEQLQSSIPVIKEFESCKNILFMLNNPKELTEINRQFPDKHVYLGFPGVSGVKKGNFTEYYQIKQQKTTLGYNQEERAMIKKIKDVLSEAGFPTVIEHKMTDWLIVHSIFISCTSAAIWKENGSSEQLGNNKKSVKLMVRSIREGFRACQQQNITIAPKNIKTIFLTMPEWFSVLYWSKAMKGNTGKLGIEPHAKVASGEMKLLATQVLDIVHKSTLNTPHIDHLLGDFKD